MCVFFLDMQAVNSCPEYPVHNYTLVVVDSEGNRATQTSQATGDIVNIAISGLREDTRYSYQVLGTNQFGDSNPSSPVDIGKHSSENWVLFLMLLSSDYRCAECHHLSSGWQHLHHQLCLPGR